MKLYIESYQSKLEDLEPLEFQNKNLSSQIDNSLVSELVGRGISWRERLTGLVFACDRNPVNFIEDILLNLNDPRGLAITPSLAVLSVAIKDLGASFSNEWFPNFEKEGFDGDMDLSLKIFYDDIGHEKFTCSTFRESAFRDLYFLHVEFWRILCSRHFIEKQKK